MLTFLDVDICWTYEHVTCHVDQDNLIKHLCLFIQGKRMHALMFLSVEPHKAVHI